MPKKKEEVKADPEVLGQLSMAEFWEWRALISDFRLEAEKASNKNLNQALKERELEICKLKAQMHQAQVTAAQERVIRVKAKLDDFYTRIEKEKGFDMRNCLIDEFTQEVKKLPEELKK